LEKIQDWMAVWEYRLLVLHYLMIRFRFADPNRQIPYGNLSIRILPLP
jgi:hypothetical protein